MRPFFEQCVASYLSLSNKAESDLEQAKTPFLDESKLDECTKEGLLQPIACKVLMKILYGARPGMIRPTKADCCPCH